MVGKRIISEHTMQKLIALVAQCKEKNIPSVVHWIPHLQEASTYVYLSVYSGEQKYYSKFKRVVVTFNTTDGHMTCRCSRITQFCLHKSLAKVHLSANLHSITFTPCEEESAFLQSQTSLRNQKITLVHDYVRYQKDFKQIPVNVDNWCFGVDISDILPKELHCPFCPNHPRLGMPTLVTGIACIYDISTVHSGQYCFSIRRLSHFKINMIILFYCLRLTYN
jgi:hypothetical protein